MNANEDFKKWACSLAGCDGGNINADIWLCGIEWGAGSRGGYYDIDLPNEIRNGVGEVCDTNHDWAESITYPYGRSFSKLYTAIKGGKVENYKDVVNLSGEDIFRVNLYPIAFDSTNHDLWHENNMREITGFESKYLYKIWCFFNRFPYFTKLRKKHKPKLVIGAGIDYLTDYLMFFGGSDSVDDLYRDIIKPKSEANKYDRTYYWMKLDNETTLVVIPFFSGRYGLNSNHLLQEMGDRIRSILNG